MAEKRMDLMVKFTDGNDVYKGEAAERVYRTIQQTFRNNNENGWTSEIEVYPNQFVHYNINHIVGVAVDYHSTNPEDDGSYE